MSHPKTNPASRTPELSAAGQPLPANWLAAITFIWAGQAASMVTSYAAGYAMVWYVTETTGSALMLAAMTICAMLPIGLVSPLGGVLADRVNRKAIMIGADLGIGVVSLVFAFVIMGGGLSLWLIALIAVVRAVGQAFHGPAMMAAMPLLVPERHLLRVNTLDQALASIACFGAPAFAILLYTTLGFSAVMFLDFAGACIAVAGLAFAKIPTVRDEKAAHENVLANLRDGVRAVGANRGLALLMGGVAFGMFVFGPLSAVFPLMTFEHFGGDGYAASLTEASFGVGMLVGSGVLMAMQKASRLAHLIALAAIVVGASTAACGLLPPTMFWAFVALVAVMAMACAWFNGPMMTLIQRHVPEEKLGRAIGLFTAVTGVAAPVGVAAGGALAEAIGVAPFFLVDGLACLALGCLVLVPRSIRALDEPREPGQAAARCLGPEAQKPGEPRP